MGNHKVKKSGKRLWKAFGGLKTDKNRENRPKKALRSQKWQKTDKNRRLIVLGFVSWGLFGAKNARNRPENGAKEQQRSETMKGANFANGGANSI
ncbi:MAG: hypothetical protein EOM72_13895 [Opitutae bacterium]|nr:hypothetical protein [Opitutae bacterium]